MGKNIINIALFGLGRIGQLHALNLYNHPKFNLKYIYDIDINLSKKFSNRFKCISINNPKTALKDKSINSILFKSAF